jgi:hypothetical protein
MLCRTKKLLYLPLSLSRSLARSFCLARWCTTTAAGLAKGNPKTLLQHIPTWSGHDTESTPNTHNTTQHNTHNAQHNTTQAYFGNCLFEIGNLDETDTTSILTLPYSKWFPNSSPDAISVRLDLFEKDLSLVHVILPWIAWQFGMLNRKIRGR